MTVTSEPAAMVTIFQNLLIICQNLLLSQVKRSMIIINKKSLQVFPPNKLPNKCCLLVCSRFHCRFQK